MFDSFFKLFTFDIGIDLGTANTRVGIKDKGVVLYEPSVVAINKATKEVLAVGKEAQRMIGRTPASVIALRPLKDGIIVDFDTTLAMLKHFIAKVHKNNSSYSTVPRPRIVVAVPSSITEVERQAVMDATEAAGAREAFIIEEPMAAAIGAGLAVNEPIGNLVVDIGGGTTDIAIISLGGIVVDKTIPIAGDEMNEQIIDFIKERYSVLIGTRTAEKIKIAVGSTQMDKKEKFVKIQGRDLLKGLPKSIDIGSQDVFAAIEPSINAITDAIKEAIEDAPPELVSDIYSQGMLLTGGGGNLKGLDKYWQEILQIKVKVAPEPSYSVVHGTLEALNHIPVLRKLKESQRTLL